MVEDVRDICFVLHEQFRRELALGRFPKDVKWRPAHSTKMLQHAHGFEHPRAELALAHLAGLRIATRQRPCAKMEMERVVAVELRF